MASLQRSEPTTPSLGRGLIAAAKKEGSLNVIALPRDWCGYGGIIDGFKQKYGINVIELNPEAGSGDELEAIKSNRGSSNGQAPDVVDIGLAFAVKAKAEGLLQPYKVAAWSAIPLAAKDVDGHWYGDYYGVLSFQVNKDLVKDIPRDWGDLIGSEYAVSIALAGDPRSSNQAIQGVFAAGLSISNGDVSKASREGLKLFADLHKRGNFVPAIGKRASLAQGTTPIIIRWDYNALADRDALQGNPPVEVVIPATGVVGGVYAQAISAYAPHPNAAKLWMEYLYSDEGQIGYLKGYCHPIRFNEMVARKKIPADLLARLPPSEAYAKVLFPTLDQQAAAKAEITRNWVGVVGAKVE
ncbi:ABC transporter substrate-binding protein [Labrys sp. KNU-23]|uniref:ABC transporter substrate-binding protein n=1 Tax=Labrys sp. KNU-23 TaxID=2789216 RepID=UPI001FEFD66D|nr:ABC transporter substrate-binding protein [Labrys sp. KNU-23]